MSSSLRPSDDFTLALPTDSADFSEASLSELSTLVRTFHELRERKGKDDVSTKMLAAQVLLASIGVFAGFLYYDPAEKCADGSCDDQWLLRGVPDAVVRHYLYFISGFTGYALTNGYFSYHAPQKMVEMLHEKNSRFAKALAAGGAIAFTLMQGVQITLTAEGAGSSALNMTMTVTGSIPGALFGAAGIVRGLPKQMAAAQQTLKSFYYNCRLHSLPPAEQTALAMTAFYLRQRQHFNDLIKANWKAVLRQIPKLVITGDEDPLAFLLSQGAEPLPESALRRGARQVMQTAVGGTLTASFVTPMLNNSYQIVNKKIDMPVASMVGVTALNATGIFGHTYLTCKAMGVATDAVLDVLSGQPVQSLVFQLRPWATGALFGVSTAFSMLSYAVVDMLYNKMIVPPSEGSHWNDSPAAVFRGFARTGIDVYHVAGPMGIGMDILFRRLLAHGTPKEKFLAHLQLMVTYLTQDMQQQEFVKFLGEQSSPAVRARLNVKSWDEFVAQMQAYGFETMESRSYVKTLGLDHYWDVISRVVTEEYKGVPTDLPVSPSRSHWQSSHYLLSPAAHVVSDDANLDQHLNEPAVDTSKPGS